MDDSSTENIKNVKRIERKGSIIEDFINIGDNTIDLNNFYLNFLFKILSNW